MLQQYKYNYKKFSNLGVMISSKNSLGPIFPTLPPETENLWTLQEGTKNYLFQILLVRAKTIESRYM